ncbi:flagellar basal body rod C-terminal domain-containing protein [Hankyongella ginsenosidimutans]|uniref:flagellar basal body rod C-terminal domain-containing protein n=1 Tax=Hankyongella ginsenosidimutans TaxID=1763828 RepID=UPI001CA32549|nr:flagellar basal body rod C-terminal domain-containing protein [Hankyongella ginsenosidimutans]
MALRGLQDQVIAFKAAGPVTAANATLSQYLGSFLGETAISAQAAEAGRIDAEALRNDVIKRRDDFAGVNLDEELANLVVFQNSYSAAARVLTAARDIYDTLLNAI